MSLEARAEYRRLIRQYRGSGLLTHFDRAGLAMLCELYARWKKAEESLAKSGLVIETKQGNLVQNPMLGIANRAQAEYRRWCIEFGLTPAARARIAIPERTTEDEFTQYIKRCGLMGDDGGERE
jgi:P27 family predicted phage terminase small subunit